MAKKKLGTTISLDSFDADLDSVLNSLEGEESTPPVTEESVAENPAPTANPSATPPKRERKQPKSSAKASPRKKKTNPSPTGDREASGVLPDSNFTPEEFGWFFSNSVDTSELKRLYIPESTKEVLQLVARSSKIPLSHLTDNILRWFLAANKQEIKKIISRHSSSLDRLDS